MAKSAWEHMNHPDALDQFAAMVHARPFASSRKECKALVAVVFRVGKTVKQADSTAMLAEAKSGTAGPIITAQSAACAALAAQYGLVGTFDWNAIITAILSALAACGL